MYGENCEQTVRKSTYATSTWTVRSSVRETWEESATYYRKQDEEKPKNHKYVIHRPAS